jgi:hypothetical protein
MGQLIDLHARMQDLLTEIKTAASEPVRIFTDPPLELPEMPAVFLLTPDEDFQMMDTENGRSIVTVVVRLCTDARKPQTALLSLADTIVAVADVWLRNAHPAPIDQARRVGMRGVTPVFGDTPTRGADFPIRIEADFRLITPV